MESSSKNKFSKCFFGLHQISALEEYLLDYLEKGYEGKDPKEEIFMSLRHLMFCGMNEIKLDAGNFEN